MLLGLADCFLGRCLPDFYLSSCNDAGWVSEVHLLDVQDQHIVWCGTVLGAVAAGPAEQYAVLA